MEIAYIVLAHKLPNQLVRLVDRLDAPWVTFLVHIDKKTDDGLFRQVAEAFNGRGNIYLLKRFKCYWGGFGVVEASLEGLRQIFLHRLQPDYIILLTGQDYPLRSNEYIRSYFERFCGTSFIDCDILPNFKEFPITGGTHLYEDWHYVARKYFHVRPVWGKRMLPLGMRPYKGSAYWNLTYECARYILTFVERNPQVVRFFKHVLTPDELFFQTVLMNANQTHPIISDHLRYHDWVRSSDLNHPKTLNVEDYEQVLASSALFARKFDETEDRTILEMLHTRIDASVGL
jgi:hypothetical protein